MTTDAPVSRGTFLALFAIFAIAWFSTLDYRALAKPDEGRYAEIAREMAVTGDWVTPRLNAIKYFEKPPLQYWATAAAFDLFGENEWTARLWAALTGFCGVLLAFCAGRRLFGQAAGLLGAAVLGTSAFFVVIGHVNTLDMGLAFFLEVALFGFLFAQQAPPGSRAERRWMIAVWVAMALATLSKGLVGAALPVMTLIVYSAVQRDLRPWKRLHFATGIPAFLVVAAPWFVAVSLANPEFPRFFFVHEHFERFLTREHGRYQAPWYFVPILLAGLLPWTGFALQALAQSWRGPPADGLNERRFLFLWVLVIFLFFSASGSKLPSYILPVFPAVAVLAGDALTRMSPRQVRWHLVLVGLVVIAVLALLPRVPGLAEPDEVEYAGMLVQYRKWLTVAAAALGAGALLALWLVRRADAPKALLVLGAAALISWQTSLLGHETLGRSNSSLYIAGEIRQELRPDAPFYSVRMYDQTLPFYLRRTVTLVDYGDEFTFGLGQEPQRAMPTMEEFTKHWLEDRNPLAIMTDDTYRRLQAERLPMRVAARDLRRVIVAKP